VLVENVFVLERIRYKKHVMYLLYVRYVFTTKLN